MPEHGRKTRTLQSLLKAEKEKTARLQAGIDKVIDNIEEITKMIKL